MYSLVDELTLSRSFSFTSGTLVLSDSFVTTVFSLSDWPTYCKLSANLSNLLSKIYPRTKIVTVTIIVK